ncbi:hypothetical protein VP02_01255 [Pseudomonas ogarae]|uniref:Uncharacterized protein n=1 Tax=Pseudomonas kilonensis TaxID=132476 RepID=A0A0F4XVZ4_9PSED|nr:hypothetical protein VP02_01255 [Pseudomonas ogarae]
MMGFSGSGSALVSDCINFSSVVQEKYYMLANYIDAILLSEVLRSSVMFVIGIMFKKQRD